MMFHIFIKLQFSSFFKRRAVWHLKVLIKKKKATLKLRLSLNSSIPKSYPERASLPGVLPLLSSQVRPPLCSNN